MLPRRRWPLPAEAEIHITSELSRGGVDFISSGRRNFKMNCPFPHNKGHDSGHNLELTKDGRMAHCWVCDWSGSWNKLSKELGLSAFDSASFTTGTYTEKVSDIDVFAKILNDFNDSVDDDSSASLPIDEISPWKTKEWRGLRRSFLKKIPTYLWEQEVTLRNKDTNVIFSTFTVDRIMWPYHQYDRLVGYVGRRLDSSDKMKYYRADWCKAKDCFFPFDYTRSNFDCRTIVLVEGEVDALVLLQAGIPALSILGSNNWGDKKRDILISTGVSDVVLLMDGDFAGRKAAKVIKSSLKGQTNVSVLKLGDGEDPGAMDKGQLEWLRSRVLP